MARCTIDGHPRSIVPIKGRHPSRWIRFAGGRYQTEDEEEIAILLKTPGVTVDLDPEEPFALKLQRLQQRRRAKTIKRARAAGKVAGTKLQGKARQIAAAAQYLLTQQESITFLDIRLRVNASLPLIAKVLREMGLHERVLDPEGRGGRRVVFERVPLEP